MHSSLAGMSSYFNDCQTAEPFERAARIGRLTPCSDAPKLTRHPRRLATADTQAPPTTGDQSGYALYTRADAIPPRLLLLEDGTVAAE